MANDRGLWPEQATSQLNVMHWKLSIALSCVLLAGCAGTTTPTTNDVPDEGGAASEATVAQPKPTMSTRDSGATVWVHDFGGVKVHTYMAPFEAFANTTHVIEGQNSVVVVDPQMTIAFAGDVRRYVDDVGKPIERLIVSHAHPDHYLGVAAAWEDVQVHALAGTIAEIESTGEEVRKAREAMFPPGWLADHVTAPTVAVELGATTIDGVEYEFDRFMAAEHAEQLAIRLPALDVTIAQDLVYTTVHPIITDRSAIESWSAHVDTLLATEDTGLVLAGHGPPTNAEGLAFIKTYLASAKTLLDGGADAPAFKAGIMAEFPDLQGEAFVDFSLFFLFPQPGQH